jgi:hypothetical protein
LPLDLDADVAPSETAALPGAPEMYAYAVIPTGAHSVDEFIAARDSDPVVAEHYVDVAPAALRTERVTKPTTAYMSYRIGDSIYWTKHKMALTPGEQILTAGDTTIRGRCGNRLSDYPMSPTSDEEPVAAAFDRRVDDGDRAARENQLAGGFGEPVSDGRPPAESNAQQGFGPGNDARARGAGGPFAGGFGGGSGGPGSGGPSLSATLPPAREDGRTGGEPGGPPFSGGGPGDGGGNPPVSGGDPGNGTGNPPFIGGGSGNGAGNPPLFGGGPGDGAGNPPGWQDDPGGGPTLGLPDGSPDGDIGQDPPDPSTAVPEPGSLALLATGAAALAIERLRAGRRRR